MDTLLLSSLAWILGASIIGFLCSVVFSSRLHLKREYFLVAYFMIGGIFLSCFSFLNGINLVPVFQHNWGWGVGAGVLASIILVRHVLSQPDTQENAGFKLGWDIFWSGLLYGYMDACLLNILPVLAVWIGTSHLSWAQTTVGRISMGALGLAASLLITLFYHLGYAEFRNRKMLKVLAGNSIITLAFLVSGNPLGALISHAAMHVAAVLRGPETTVQLPPHYQNNPFTSQKG